MDWMSTGVALLALGAAWPAYSGDDQLDTLVREARGHASRLQEQVATELKREFELGGSLRAVIVCKYAVPELSSAISRQSGARVTRVSLRPRNPLTGMADEYEARILREFERRLARGERIDSLEQAEVVREGERRFFRYMKAIPVTEFCVACHGPRAGIAPALRAQILGEYPHDQAVDYRVGQIRGAVSVKKPL